MKNFFSLSALIVLLMGSLYSTDIFAVGDDEGMQHAQDFKEPELPATSGRATAKRKRGDKLSEGPKKEPEKKKKKPDTSKQEKSNKGSASGSLLETAEQGVHFVIDHKDTIISAAEKTSEVADSLIGDGDGKLSTSEAIDALKELGGMLVSVKNVVGGLFKKKDTSDASGSAVPAVGTTRRFATPGSSTKRAAANVSNLFPKNLSPNVLIEKVGNKFDNVQQALSGVALQFEKLTDLAPAELSDFVDQHQEFKGRVEKLIACLQGGVSNDSVEIAQFMNSIESALKQTAERVQSLEQDFYQEVSEQVSLDSVKALFQTAGQDDFLRSSVRSLPVTRGRVAPVQFEGLEDDESLLEDDVQQAGALFANLLNDEGNNKKLTVKDLPDVLKIVTGKISSIQNLFKSTGEENPSQIELKLTQVKAHILEIGKGLTQLTQIVNDPAIADSIEDKDLKSLKEQLMKYAKMVQPKRNATIDPQMVGECLQLTLEFINQVQVLIPVVQAMEQQMPETFLTGLNWKKVTAYTGSSAAVLAAVVAVGQQQGWWSLASTAL